MQLYGKAKEVANVLYKNPVPAALFTGPSSVGKKTTAFQLRRAYGLTRADSLWVPKMDSETARDVVRFASTAPDRGEFKLAIIDLQHSNAWAQNVLLKVLEEPLATRFILISHHEPIPTVTSRCTEFKFPLLSDSEVAAILMEFKHLPDKEAEAAAKFAAGQIKRALIYDDFLSKKPLVLAALNAMRNKDSAILDSLAGKWSNDHTEILIKGCYEFISKSWQLFSEEELSSSNRAFYMKILVSTRAHVSPRLVVRHQLASVLRG